MLVLRVNEKRDEAENICVLELVNPTGGDLPSFSAGSHVDVMLPNGLTRQYSLCNVPSETHRYALGVLRDARSKGGSVYIHDRVKVGDLLEISEPKNFFELDKSATNSLLFAGGIGVTPMASMAQQLAEDGADFELHYCARSRAQAAFVWRIEESSFRDRAFFHFDDGAAEQRLDIDRVLGDAPEGTHIYVCGPKGFMEHVVSAAHRLGWPSEHIHREVFEHEDASQDANRSFQVKIASTGAVYTIPPDMRVTKALREQGVFIPTSCTQGVCGTCLTGVLEGEPDHRDHYLTEEEREANTEFLPCCSRSLSPMLVLDL